MKKTFFAVTVVGVVMPAFVQAQSNVTLYGRLNTSFESQGESGFSSGSAMRSNASRFGVRGTEDLGGGLKAIFAIESGLNSDSGASGFGGALRQSFVGFSGGFGSAIVGRIDGNHPFMVSSPMNKIAGLGIYTVNHDIGSSGITSGGAKQLGITTKDRASNAFAYATPNMGGFTVAGRVALEGPEDAQTGINAGNSHEQDIRSYMLSGHYDKGPLAVGLAFESVSWRNSAAAGADAYKGKWLTSAHYDFGVVRLGGLVGRDGYKNVTSGNRTATTHWGLSAQTPIGNHVITAGYYQDRLQFAGGGKEKIAQIGYAYNFSKRTQAYTFYDLRDPDSSNTSAVANSGSYTADKNRKRTLAIGVRHNF